jgi:SPP1 family phage portal protein
VKSLDENNNKSPVIRNDMFGRLDIYASFDDINEGNLIAEVNEALVYHVRNMLEEEFLYWYTRGVQPILNRKKEVREDILNIVQVNTAAEIVDFKNGYFLTQPCSYVSRRKGVQTKVKKLNEYLYRSGKQDADNEVSDWFHRVGKAPLFVEPGEDNEVPFRAYALDPRSAFVVYSLRPGNKPVMAVNLVTVDGVAKLDVFTENMVYHLTGTVVGKMITTEKNHDYMVTATTLDYSEPNVLGYIPIIEYRYNSINTSAFELAIPLIDEISNLTSNACDGVEQFIQSLAIAVNCEFPENTTITDIRKAGMIALRSIGENKADFKVLSEQLDQTQTKTLTDNLYDEILRICAMPSRNTSGSSTYDTTGAAVLANFGWYQADAAARNTEDLFKKSNRQFDRIIVEILRRKGLLDIDLNDFEINFVRNETANVQSKAQAFQTLMAAGLHPELAAAKSGISNDPVKDMKMSEKWLEMIWGNPDKVVQAEQTDGGQGEAEVVESDNDNGEDDTGGAV